MNGSGSPGAKFREFEYYVERWIGRCTIAGSEKMRKLLQVDEAREQLSYVSLVELQNPLFIVELNGERRFERLE